MILFKHSFCYTVIFLCGTLCDAQGIGKRISIDPYHYTIQKDVEANNGIVACAHLLAAKVGLDILMQGGNDIDVAIAIQLALAVVYPGAGNLGGEEFMAATPDNGKKMSLDFREVAPAMAKEDMYADNGTGKPDIQVPREGYLASGMPGTVWTPELQLYQIIGLLIKEIIFGKGRVVVGYYCHFYFMLFVPLLYD